MAINMTGALNNAIPGFSGTTATTSKLIKELLAGKLTSGERGAIYDAGAERATLGGMPGASAKGGSLFANADLKNIGLASGQRQQQGIQDFLSMLQGYSGTVVPTVGQEMQNNQFNLSQAQQESQFGRTYGLQRDTFDEGKRRFNFENWIGRDYSSDPNGQVYDASGKNLGYKSRYDRNSVYNKTF
jgi:hypothetical protein